MLKNQAFGALILSLVFLGIFLLFRKPDSSHAETNELPTRNPLSSGPQVSNLKVPRFEFLWKPRILLDEPNWKLETTTSQSQEPQESSKLTPQKRQRRTIRLSLASQEAQLQILDSEEYSKKAEPMYTTDPPCEPQYEWMTQTHPVCNNLHEIDLTDMIQSRSRKSNQYNSNDEQDVIEKFRFVANGGYRDVFMVRDSNTNVTNNWNDYNDNSKLALKTLKSNREFTERHFDRHRRDAVAADRLTAVATSVDIYAFCGQSAIYQFAKGGNLKQAIDKHVTRVYEPQMAWNSTRKLQVAHMVAKSIADLHNVDQEGRASIAHTDISTDQFISINGDGYYQLNDFNRARFLRQNTHDKTANCPFTVKSNKGKFRSPEEYLALPETEAVDNYSMGNIFFVLLTGTYPFPDKTKKEVKILVGEGERPSIAQRLLTSSDQNEQALIAAAKMCWAQNPNDRASSRQVQLFLESKLGDNKNGAMTGAIANVPSADKSGPLQTTRNLFETLWKGGRRNG